LKKARQKGPSLESYRHHMLSLSGVPGRAVSVCQASGGGIQRGKPQMGLLKSFVNKETKMAGN